VFEALLNYFSTVTEHSCIIKVYPIVADSLKGEVGESRLPSTLSSFIRYQPFLMQVVKLPKSEKACIFSFKQGLKEAGPICTRDELVAHVQRLQNERFVMHTKIFKQGQRYELASSETKDGIPRFSFTVLDAQDEILFNQKTVGVFVVPIGCEREMDIYNVVKQRALFDIAPFARLIIVILGRAHKYESLDQIK